MQHSAYINLFKELAELHKDIAHNRNVPDSTRLRKSFFLINNEEEYNNALGNYIDFPAMVLLPVYGHVMGDELAPIDVIVCSFEIRKYVNSPDNYTATESARSECKRIGNNIIAKIMQDMDDAEDQNICHLLTGLDVRGIEWDFIGPVGNNEFGCSFKLTVYSRASGMSPSDIEDAFYSSGDEGIYATEYANEYE